MAESSTLLAVESPARSVRWRMPAILAPLASLRLTVVLFLLSMILVFSGTLAQMDAGVWTVVSKYFRSLYVWIPLQTYMGFGRIFLGFPSSWQIPTWIGFPFPGGWTLGAALLLNLLAAHLVRFRVTWQRAGILLTHSGIVLLLLGELITGLYQVEARMTMALGESANFIDVSRDFELVFTRDDGKLVEEITIPHTKLVNAAVVTAPELPVDVEVIRYVNHSAIMLGRPDNPQSITASDGRSYAIDFNQKEATGVDAAASEDIPSVAVRFRKKGTSEELASGEFSCWFYPNLVRLAQFPSFPPRSLTVGDNTWIVSLRPRREYKPYSLQLLEFRHDKYIGTEIAKNYSSLVRVRDAAGDENRTQLISMNSPLRYHGDSLFQQNVLPGGSGTVLQVVRNPGRLLPYISCTMVGLGMLIHFVQGLISFFSRRTAVTVTFGAFRWTPWLVALATLGYFVALGWPRPDPPGVMRFSEFSRLPVVQGGRIKPIDTFARVMLQLISARQEVSVDLDGKPIKLTPVTWLLHVWAGQDMLNGPAAKYRVFRIDNAAVLGFLELEARPGSFRYSLDEISPRFDRLGAALMRIQRIEKKDRDELQNNLMDLGDHLMAYERIARMREPLVIPPSTNNSEEWQSIESVLGPIQQTVSEFMAEEMKRQGKATEQLDVKGVQELIDKLSLAQLERASPTAKDFLSIVGRFRADDAAGFNAALEQFQSRTRANISDASRWRVTFESAFNQVSPFYQCMALYVFVVVLACLSWLWPDGPLGRVALGLGVSVFVIHTAAILARMYIQGRPPVTNLYSSAIFIGWGAVGGLLVLERLHPYRIALALAGALGASSLVVAHFLGLGGDTMEMMQAVLDTNFWLATHVTCVTLGYTATFVAGFIAVTFLFIRALNPAHPRLKTLADMIYGIVCFATLFSFVGTVLGGIWADFSWGRFWGWDPKENGALLIVIWNALILHARWAGIVKARGMAGLAVLGNIVAAWSWFGTNQLGVGLHAYGSTSGTALALMIFDGAMLFIAALALVPTPTTNKSPAAVS